MRQAGYTSREVPFFVATDAAANGVDFLYRTKTAQGLINSQEAHFLSIYSGVAGIEFAAAEAFSQARVGVSMAGKAFELRHMAKHLPGAAKAGEEAHMFNDLATMSRVESEIFSRGIYTSSRGGVARHGLYFDAPIGTRIGKDGTSSVLNYGQMKISDDGFYHVVPRNGPGKP